MDQLIATLSKLKIVRGDFDFHLMRATMVALFVVFGCQKWFDYEAHAIVPFIKNGPLIFWLYPLFGIRGEAFFLGSAEWLFGLLLFIGFWNKKVGILGALAHARPTCQRSRSSRSFPTPGLRRPEVFRPRPCPISFS